MPDYRFERECRTSDSEIYTIVTGEDTVGRIDLHFTPNVVYGTLCVEENVSDTEIDDLIEIIDDDLVTSGDPMREDFVVTVYRGQEVGVYSNETFEEEEEEEEDGEEEDHNGHKA